MTASKIATLKFNADWVVLSACNTAAATAHPKPADCRGSRRRSSMPALVRRWSRSGGCFPQSAQLRLSNNDFSGSRHRDIDIISAQHF
jgi:hypothetical protein